MEHNCFCVPDRRPRMGPGREPVELGQLADRLVRAISLVLAVVAVVLAAAVALDWTPVLTPALDLAPDPAGAMPF
jgi:hypothetical protein